MLEAREEVGHEILWEMSKGTTNIWHENCTDLGALYHVVPSDFNINENLQDVAEFRQGNDWNHQQLDQTFPSDIADHIKQEIHFDNNDEFWDTPKWIPTPPEKFSVTTAWQIMRHRAPTNHEYKLLWTKGLPFKISFFLWLLWKNKIPTDDIGEEMATWWYQNVGVTLNLKQMVFNIFSYQVQQLIKYGNTLGMQ